MALPAGARVGVYEVSALLGAGGMGEVYRARDPKLGRDVAIKVLPELLAADAQHMARFEREAQVLASLNHPNIATVYGVEQNALVMELVEGQTLADRIAAGALPIEEALLIARQIVEGLEAAHDRGIVHRDLKPANVKITPAGVVKLLDFGLAKAADPAPSTSRQLAISPTLSMAMTQAGMIPGTAGYMSPEQARGKPVDRRTDIWAFGVVLYEMLTGRALFATGDTVTDIIAAVVTREPGWDALPASVPPHIRRLLERCLRKDVKTRLQSIGEARIAIDEPAAMALAVPGPPPAEAWRRWLPWAMVAGVAILAGAGWWRATRPPALRPLVRLNVEMKPDAPLPNSVGAGAGGLMALSPNGTRLVVTLRGADGKLRLHTRLLHQSQLAPLAGTEDGSSPFFSPDGHWIAFAADGRLKKISVEGGSAVTVCDAPNMRGASWGDDGNIVLALNTTGGLSRVSSDGSKPRELTKLDEGERTHRWPQVLPGSEAVLFTAHSVPNTYDTANIDVVSLKTGHRKTVQRGAFYGRYMALPNGFGRLIYMHQNTLFAAPFDVGRLAVTGTAVPVLEDVSGAGSRGGDFSFSSSGTFVYLGKETQGGWMISWLDASGKRQPLHAIPGSYFTPRFSPDGKRLAFTRASTVGYDLWVKDLDRDTPSRLSFLDGTNDWPVWSPDGNNIVFKSTSSSGPGLYWIRSDGAGAPQRLSDGKLDETPYSISPDGKRLAFSRRGNGSSDLFTVPIEGDSRQPKLGKPELFLGTPFAEAHPAFSPDGRWLAYMSLESATPEIYVRPFPGPGGRWQISTGGGSYPVWSRDGGQLLFKGPDDRVMRVGYSVQGDSFLAGASRVWPVAPVMTFGNLSTWDLAPDVSAWPPYCRKPTHRSQTRISHFS
ncbi:MAG TPA: protein kinase [Bryobacteraceae bacterium]|nr:protein kinase [Bryobacteraceae bacterium]